MAERFSLTGDLERDRAAIVALDRCIAAGGVAVIPTDTVYGLACHPELRAGVARLYEVKERPPDKPSALIFFSLESAIQRLGFLPPPFQAAVQRLLPGPLTLLLPNPSRRWRLACEPQQALAGEPPAGEPPALGVRVPRLEGRLAALAQIKGPLLQSSANRSGGSDAPSLAEMEPEVVERADLVLDGGAVGGQASTVVDLRCFVQGEVKVLREGPVPAAAVEAALADLC